MNADRRSNLSIGPVVAIVVIFIITIFVTVVLPGVMRPSEVYLQLGSGLFRTKVAINNVDRAKGLSGVTELDSNQGLLIAFPGESKWGIWMKDMKMPIDIVWLDKDKKVIYIVKGASPESSTSKIFSPRTPAKYVVELPAGTVEASSIKLNNYAIFQIDESSVN